VVRFQTKFPVFASRARKTTLNTTLNFTGTYPNNLTVANNPYNAAGQLVNQNGFGTTNTKLITNTTVPAPNPRILQTLIRIQF